LETRRWRTSLPISDTARGFGTRLSASRRRHTCPSTILHEVSVRDEGSRTHQRYCMRFRYEMKAHVPINDTARGFGTRRRHTCPSTILQQVSVRDEGIRAYQRYCTRFRYETKAYVPINDTARGFGTRRRLTYLPINDTARGFGTRRRRRYLPIIDTARDFGTRLSAITLSDSARRGRTWDNVQR
jgi:hypothetical protein